MVLVDTPQMDDAVAAVKNARVVIMNPPFTARPKMGEKFDKNVQEALRDRMDSLEGCLERSDTGLSELLDKSSLGPQFAALAELCANRLEGLFTTVLPTTALTNPSGLAERVGLAMFFHIETVLTCHSPSDINMSQDTAINESIIVMRRCENSYPDTRIISLDRFPSDENEVADLGDRLTVCASGDLGEGWGEVFWWPRKRIERGDWSAAVWRSACLAEASARFAESSVLRELARSAGGGGGTSPQNGGRPRNLPAGGQRRSDPVRVHATLQTLWADYRRTERAR